VPINPNQSEADLCALMCTSEYGETWHKAGMLSKKQRVFDDFQAAAEYLVEHKYTSPSKYVLFY